MLHGKYGIITLVYLQWEKTQMEVEGGGKPSGEMTKPVKIVLSCLHVTKLGHCYYFPSFKIPELGEACSIQAYLLLT